jgi:hypothetical protein
VLMSKELEVGEAIRPGALQVLTDFHKRGTADVFKFFEGHSRLQPVDLTRADPKFIEWINRYRLVVVFGSEEDLRGLLLKTAVPFVTPPPPRCRNPSRS